jgi:hypothetical protein
MGKRRQWFEHGGLGLGLVITAGSFILMLANLQRLAQLPRLAWLAIGVIVFGMSTISILIGTQHEIERLSKRLHPRQSEVLSEDQIKILENGCAPYSKLQIHIGYRYDSSERCALDLQSMFHRIGCANIVIERDICGIDRGHEDFWLSGPEAQITNRLTAAFQRASIIAHSDEPSLTGAIEIYVGRLNG